jgi:hypothetical protein
MDGGERIVFYPCFLFFSFFLLGEDIKGDWWLVTKRNKGHSLAH